MNKFTAVLYLLLLSIGTIVSLYIPDQAAEAEETIVIPKEAIRLRILANSDNASDQDLKRKIRDAVNAEITKWVADIESLPKARALLKEKLPEIQAIAMKTAEEEGSSQSVKAEFGKVKFPTKLYGQFLYPAGEYEAILITIGEGEGANWWCVLYPPLCFLDFSNGAAVGPGIEENSAEDQEKEPVYAEGEVQVPEVKLAIVEIFKRNKQ
ncbi:stage II sporulation protein R [Bacillus ectoiniformans]|uniref:stage II sporulation protein R n=1 Tax=Bacillus ectoiniformans TaxID=1494429 RepID=UPI00195C7D0C|nr:stage II sporulation protein R [Bacillus ectoiniformans]MBM7648349.1 stage II sporulation protein R [Bacillus ectoiniformans]